jgi:probable HAF family extracellular repeat protein
MGDLGTLGGAASYALDISGSGRVVGAAQITGTSAYHAFLYADNTMHDLGTLGGTESYASGINALGQVVGWSQLSGTSQEHAFLYADNVMVDLNTLLPSGSGWTLSQARAVNDAGQIVGIGYNPSGEQHAFLLTQAPLIPEPSTMMLLALGSFSLLRRKHRH